MHHRQTRLLILVLRATHWNISHLCPCLHNIHRSIETAAHITLPLLSLPNTVSHSTLHCKRRRSLVVGSSCARSVRHLINILGLKLTHQWRSGSSLLSLARTPAFVLDFYRTFVTHSRMLLSMFRICDYLILLIISVSLQVRYLLYYSISCSIPIIYVCLVIIRSHFIKSGAVDEVIHCLHIRNS